MSSPHHRRPGRPRSHGGPKSCTHEDHDTLWPDLPRLQGEECFYSHSTKCKKCYIFLQTDRVRRARQGLGPAPRPSSRRGRDAGAVPHHAAALQARSAEQARRPAKRRAVQRGGRDAASEAMLGGPVLHVSSSGSAEDAASLRAAAVATAWGAAILNEVRELAPAVDVPEQPASLSLLGAAVRSALSRASAKLSSPREQAHLAGVWRLCESRLGDAAAATRQAAREAAAMGGGCPCGRSYDYQSNAGPPVLCQGCARAYHAACAGSPDEAFTCPECAAGTVAVVRLDEARADFFVMAADEEEEAAPAPAAAGGAGDEDATLGRALWSASRNHRLESSVLRLHAQHK